MASPFLPSSAVPFTAAVLLSRCLLALLHPPPPQQNKGEKRLSTFAIIYYKLDLFANCHLKKPIDLNKYTDVRMLHTARVQSVTLKRRRHAHKEIYIVFYSSSFILNYEAHIKPCAKFPLEQTLSGFISDFFFFFPNDSKPSEGQIEKKKKTFPAALGTKNDRSVVSLTIQSIGLIFALLSKA